jgi:hypothetical protein
MTQDQRRLRRHFAVAIAANILTVEDCFHGTLPKDGTLALVWRVAHRLTEMEPEELPEKCENCGQQHCEQGDVPTMVFAPGCRCCWCQVKKRLARNLGAVP